MDDSFDLDRSIHILRRDLPAAKESLDSIIRVFDAYRDHFSEDIVRWIDLTEAKTNQDIEAAKRKVAQAQNARYDSDASDETDGEGEQHSTCPVRYKNHLEEANASVSMAKARLGEMLTYIRSHRVPHSVPRGVKSSLKGKLRKLVKKMRKFQSLIDEAMEAE